jgi:hypothetical protein
MRGDICCHNGKVRTVDHAVNRPICCYILQSRLAAHWAVELHSCNPKDRISPNFCQASCIRRRVSSYRFRALGALAETAAGVAELALCFGADRCRENCRRAEIARGRQPPLDVVPCPQGPRAPSWHNSSPRTSRTRLSCVTAGQNEDHLARPQQGSVSLVRGRGHH